MMGEEKKIQVEEVDKVDTPPRARVTPETPATLVSFRPEETPADVVARLHEADVHVRELPGRGLVRASCGWWTSDEDLDRLVAALEA